MDHGSKIDDISVRKSRSIDWDWSLGAMTLLQRTTAGCAGTPEGEGKGGKGKREGKCGGTGRIKSSRVGNSPPKVDERTAMATCLPMKLHDEAIKSMQDMQDL